MTENKAIEILKLAGLKNTPKRKILLEILLSAEKPLSQKEIARCIPPEISFNQVSLYRALDSFRAKGLIHQVITDDRIRRFAFSACGEKGHEHPHFFCRNCGDVCCLKSWQLPDLAGELNNYKVESQELFFKGLCANCNQA